MRLKEFILENKIKGADGKACWDGYRYNGTTDGKDSCVKVGENFNGEYDDEAGMAHTNLHTIARAAQGLLDTIDDQENLPEWVQEKIAKVEGMMVSAWNYLKSQEEQGIDPRQELDELSFLGSQCTKDCSGHRAGYNWYKQKGRDPLSHSQSFNNGAGLAKAGK